MYSRIDRHFVMLLEGLYRSTKSDDRGRLRTTFTRIVDSLLLTGRGLRLRVRGRSPDPQVVVLDQDCLSVYNYLRGCFSFVFGSVLQLLHQLNHEHSYII